MGKRDSDLDVLRQQVATLQDLYLSAPVGLCRMRNGLVYTNINKWLARINGLSVEEHIGRDVRDILPQVAAGVLPEILPVLETGEPVINSTNHVETAAHPGIKRLYQYSFFPVKSPDGNVTAVDCVVADISDVFEGFMRDISKHEATEDLRSRLVDQVFRAQDLERHRIAVDLHDGVCQMLSAARLRVDAIAAGAGTEDLSTVSQILHQSIEDIRAISHNLHPAILDDLGIVAAIKKACSDLAEASSCRVDFDCAVDPSPLPADLQNHLFRLVQEGLQNAAKHADCDRVVVSMEEGASDLLVCIADNGVGFDPDDPWAPADGSGITNMKERARLLGAELTIDSVPGRGTKVCIRVPRPEDD